MDKKVYTNSYERTQALRACVHQHFRVIKLISKTRAKGRKHLTLIGITSFTADDDKLAALECKIRKSFKEHNIDVILAGFTMSNVGGVMHHAFRAYVDDIKAVPVVKPHPKGFALLRSTSEAAVRTRWVEGCVPTQ